MPAGSSSDNCTIDKMCCALCSGSGCASNDVRVQIFGNLRAEHILCALAAHAKPKSPSTFLRQ